MPDSWSSIACHHRNMGFAVRVRLYCSNVASGYWCRHSGICVAQWRSSRIRPCCWNGHGSLLLLGRCTARKHRNVDHFAVAAQHGLAGCRVLFDPCNSRARSVLCFPSEGLSRPGGSMMWSRYKVRKVHQIPIVERMWQAIAQQIAAADPKPLRGFGRLSSGVRPRRSERSLLEVLTPLF